MFITLTKETKYSLAYPLLVMSLAAGFLFYKYVLQIFPSIITEQLMQQFKLSGVGLGMLAATFYYSYMVTQLFVGVLLDKYGTRKLTASAILCCALGVLVFSHAETLWAASSSRALMGIGVAFATVAYMKLTAVWFAPKYYALVSGLLATAAMAGAVFGQAPLAWLVNNYGWRDCLLAVGVIGVCLAGLFFLFVRERESEQSDEIKEHSISLKEVAKVFKNKQNWLLTLYSGLAFSPVAVFGGLWGNPFLEQAYQLSKTEAASLVSLVFIGLGLGSPLLGLLSSRINHRLRVMFYSTVASFVSLMLIVYYPYLPLGFLSVLLFSFGFGLGAFMLVFAIGKDINPLALMATVIAMINTSDAALDALTEPLIGKLLDLGWTGEVVNGVHQFTVNNFQMALAPLPIYLCAAAVLLLCLKEPQQN